MVTTLEIPDGLIQRTKSTVSPKKSPARAKRKPTAYALFTQKQMASECCRNLPHKERFAHVAKKWREAKKSAP